MVQTFSNWVKTHRVASRKPRASSPSTQLSAVDEEHTLARPLDEEIDDMLSELGSVRSVGASTLGHMITRNPSIVSDARIQRLEIEVLRLTEELKRLSETIRSLVTELSKE